MFDPAAMYSGIGRLVSADGITYVGNVAYLAGRGDTTQAVIGLSMSNHSLGFQRDGNVYAARYRIDFQFDRTGRPPVMVTREETVRVATFNETVRIDESLLLQQVIPLLPGQYTLTVKVTDLMSKQTGLSRLSTTVPAYPAGSITRPILVYDVGERRARGDSLQLVLNPRGTIAYGGDTLRVYVEGVGYTVPTDVPLEVRDDRDSVIIRRTLHMTGQREIESFHVDIAPDRTPLGRVELRTGADTASRVQAVVSFSQSWVVTNFNDLIDMLKYFGSESRVNALRKAKSGDRAQLWREFLQATDPNPATPENEAIESYFARLAYANYRFRDEGMPGWRTDRGEVFIAMGEPNEILDRSLEPSNRYWAWTYAQPRVTLYFQDVSGFNRFRLTPQSRGDFEIAKLSVRRRDYDN